MSKVHLEILGWLTETLGIEGTNEIIFDQEIEGDKTVKDLLNQLAPRYQRFRQMVFDVKAQKLTGRVGIFFNGHILESVNGLETKLKDGDILTFIPPMVGG